MLIKEWNLNFMCHLSVNLMQPSQNNNIQKIKNKFILKVI